MMYGVNGWMSPHFVITAAASPIGAKIQLCRGEGGGGVEMLLPDPPA
jgi:hypothetical protein